MKCTLCNTLLQPDATWCASCGSPVRTSSSSYTADDSYGDISYGEHISFVDNAPNEQENAAIATNETDIDGASTPFLPSDIKSAQHFSQKPSHALSRPVISTLLLIFLALSLIMAGGFAFYQFNVYPQTLHAQATTVAQNFLTEQIEAPTQTATAYDNLYSQVTKSAPTVADPLSDANNSSWTVTTDSQGSCTFANNAYDIQSSVKNDAHICYDPNNVFSNFACQVQMSFIQGDANTVGGIIIRLQGGQQISQGYFFSVNAVGRYELDAYSTGGNQKMLAHGTSPSIITGLSASNQFGIMANGTQISLYINQKFITSVTDSSSATGLVALFASENFNPVNVAFSNFQLWKLP